MGQGPANVRNRGGRPPKDILIPRAEVVARYAAGASLDDLAGATGVSASTVKNMLRAAGVTLRPRGGSRRPSRTYWYGGGPRKEGS